MKDIDIYGFDVQFLNKRIKQLKNRKQCKYHLKGEFVWENGIGSRVVFKPLNKDTKIK